MTVDSGTTKSLTIRPYTEATARMPKGKLHSTLLYVGDGVSDLSAAQETDLLFAKVGHDLITYCERENILFTSFEGWSSILETTRDIYEMDRCQDPS
jgi:2-hydroxy-3-keto-5-methylthiopentenyl-1-phosphate phosphatase